MLTARDGKDGEDAVVAGQRHPRTIPDAILPDRVGDDRLEFLVVQLRADHLPGGDDSAQVGLLHNRQGDAVGGDGSGRVGPAAGSARGGVDGEELGATLLLARS